MSHRSVETRRKASSGAVLVRVLLILALLLSCGGIGDEAKYSVSGRVTSAGSALPGVTMTLSGNGSGTTITDANGNYGFGDLEWGTYTVTPTLAGYQFMPAFRNVYLQGINGEGFNFNAGRPIQVSTSSHTLFQKSDGTVWAWGNNASGRLGDGSTTDSPTPVQVGGLSGVTAVLRGWSPFAGLEKRWHRLGVGQQHPWSSRGRIHDRSPCPRAGRRSFRRDGHCRGY